jgi:REP element-mobilizing transposase RayT
MLVELHPSQSLAEFIRWIKSRTSRWIHEERIFSEFDQWQKGYAAFSISFNDRQRIIEYIKNQEEHHKTTSFLDEYRAFLEEAGFEMDSRYLP